MAFRFDKLTQKAQEAVQHAQELASQNGHQQMQPVHLLISLATEKEGIVRAVLEKCGAPPDAVIQEASSLLNSLPKVSGQQAGVYVAPSLNEVFEAAFKEAENFKDEFVSTEHLL